MTHADPSHAEFFCGILTKVKYELKKKTARLVDLGNESWISLDTQSTHMVRSDHSDEHEGLLPQLTPRAAEEIKNGI